MVYNIFVGEPKVLSAAETLERAKTDAMNQAQIGFVKGTVQSAVNGGLNNFKLW